jgi:hypothetical protein
MENRLSFSHPCRSNINHNSYCDNTAQALSYGIKKEVVIQKGVTVYTAAPFPYKKFALGLTFGALQRPLDHFPSALA